MFALYTYRYLAQQIDIW